MQCAQALADKQQADRERSRTFVASEAEATTASHPQEDLGVFSEPSAPVAQNGGKCKRQPQNVATKRDKLKVVKWMIEAEKQEKKRLFKRTIDHFPGFFRASDSANYMKVSLSPTDAVGDTDILQDDVQLTQEATV
ncbi:hypothetical protein GN958_ATG17267 [Phytophthora infestans]|nr:hypothetical protein GN958_ATG17267 [Phytophthora infestans]